MKKLTAATKKAVLGDWNNLSPAFAPHQPLHLLKRHGPILVGIYLKPTRDGTMYTPTAHIHNLCVAFPVVSLQLRAEAKPISVSAHTPESCRARHEELAKAYPLHVSNDVTLAQVVALYASYFEKGLQIPIVARLPSYAELIALLSFSGFLEQARTVADHVADAVPPTIDGPSGERLRAYHETVARALGPGMNADDVERNLATLNAAAIPSYDFSVKMAPPMSWLES